MMKSCCVPSTVYFSAKKICGNRRLKVNIVRVQQAVRHCQPKSPHQRRCLSIIYGSEEIEYFLAGGTWYNGSYYCKLPTQKRSNLKGRVPLNHEQNGCIVCCKKRSRQRATVGSVTSLHGKERQLDRLPPCFVWRRHHPSILPET